jgi:hypothetical protein
VLQDPTATIAAHRSSLPTGEHQCPEPLFRLPAALSFGYAPPPPALLGVTPKSRWCSRGAPHHRLAAVGPLANTPPCRPARSGHAADARCARMHTGRSAVGPGHQAVAQPVCRPAARDRPPRLAGCNPGPVAGPVLCRGFNHFLIVLNYRNCFKL